MNKKSFILTMILIGVLCMSGCGTADTGISREIVYEQGNEKTDIIIKNEAESKKLLKAYCEKKEMEYVDPDKGSHWVVADIKEPEVQSIHIGTGECKQFVYKNINYKMNVYPLGGTMYYYAVPNGCDDYSLVINNSIYCIGGNF